VGRSLWRRYRVLMIHSLMRHSHNRYYKIFLLMSRGKRQRRKRKLNLHLMLLLIRWLLIQILRSSKAVALFKYLKDRRISGPKMYYKSSWCIVMKTLIKYHPLWNKILLKCLLYTKKSSNLWILCSKQKKLGISRTSNIIKNKFKSTMNFII